MFKRLFLILVVSVLLSFEVASQISSFPYSESFESGFVDWSNVSGDDFNWSRRSNSTPTNNTGPSSAEFGSSFLYIESSNPNNPNKSAYLEATFDFSTLINPEFSFYYYMYGVNVNNIQVDVFDDTWNTNVWSISGEQHSGPDESWSVATIDLSVYAGLSSVTIRIRGVSGINSTSDICVDNFACIEACTGVNPGNATSSSYSLCSNGTVDLNLSGHSGTVQWQSSSDNITFSNISGATSADYTTPTLTATNYYYYRAAVTNSCTRYSDTVIVSVTSTNGTVGSFIYTESFESGFGSWSNNTGDDMNWTRISGGTPSNSTGPSGASDGSSYLYTESSSSGNPSKEAFLDLTFDFTSISSPSISFDYHMYGSGTGDIALVVNGQALHTISGPQQSSNDQAWETAEIDLSSYGNQCNVLVQIFALTGSSSKSDMGIDNIKVWEPCDISGGTSAVSEASLCAAGTVDLSLSGQDAGGAIQWQQSTDNITFSDISGATSTPYTSGTLSLGNNYYFRALVTNGCTQYSDTSNVSVFVGGGVSSYPYSESFETDFGVWTNLATDDFDWTRRTGTTPSGSTGPSGAADASYYIYTEASSPNYPSKTAYLEADFDFTTLTSPELQFSYHMYGSRTGTMMVDVNGDNGVWSKSGQQNTGNSDPWNEASIDLSNYIGQCNVTIRIRAITGTGSAGDMAIDNISLCSVNPGTASISNTTLCSAGTVDLSLSSYEGGASIQWQQSTDNITFADISGATSTPYTTASLSTGSSYYFRAVVTNSCSDISNTVNVTVSNGSGGVSSFPYSESFETDFGIWTNPSASDDFDWSRNSGNTGTSNTGPSSANDGSYYLYTEASSPNNPSETAYLDGLFDFTGISNPTLSFYYHMYGSNINALYLDVNGDNAVWSLLGQQQSSSSDAWIKAEVDLSSYGNACSVMLRFRGLTGSGSSGDIGIDNIEVYQPCAIAGGSAGISDNSLCAAGTVDLSLTSYDGGATIQWQQSTDNITFSDFSGATSANYTTGTLSTGSTYYYRAMVTNSCFVFSDTVNVNVNAANGGAGLPYSEDFESGTGIWTNPVDDDFDWTRRTGGTPTNSSGPSTAHSGSYFMYTEASSPNNPNKTAKLQANFDFTGVSSPILKFYYHMYGVTMGSMYVDVNNDLNVWSKTGQQHTSNGEAWSSAEVDLSAYGGQCNVSIIIRGYTGSNSTGDMAVDFIEICDPPSTAAIVGSDSVCVSSSSVNYSVPAPTSSSYTWVITGGAANPSPGANDTSITVDWGSTGMAGKVQVVENTGCIGDTVSYAVNIHSIAVDSIYGDASVQENATDIAYSVIPATGYTYTWTISGGNNDPAPKTGQSTESITIDWGTSGAGSVQVVAVSACGSASADVINITKYAPVESIAIGDWDQPATWNCSCALTSTDDVTIKTGGAVTLVANTTVNSLSVESSATLDVGGFVLTVDGDFIMEGNISGDGSASSRVDFNGAVVNVSGSGTISNVNQVRFQGGNKDILAGTSIIINDANVRLYDGITVTNKGSVTIENNMDRISGTPTWVNDVNSTLVVGGNLLASNAVLTADAVGNTVTYNGTSGQIVKVPSSSYYNIIFSGAGTKTLGGSISITGDITNSSVLDASGSNYNINISGDWANTGSFNARSGTVAFVGDVQNFSASSTETFNNLTVNSTDLIIPSGDNVTVDGNLSIGGGMTLKSPAGLGQAASLITNGNVSGTLNVERYMTADAWHYYSSPVSGQSTSIADGFNFYYWDEPAGQDDWMLSWTKVPEGGSFQKMVGYTNNFDNSEPITYTGTPYSGSHSITLSNTTGGAESPFNMGWNVVGNPYPCAINWDAASGWTKTNIDDAVYYWDHSLSNYAAYVSGVGINGGTQYIPATQGFFVKVTTPGSGTLGVDDDIKIHSNQNFYRKGAKRQNIDLLKLHVSGYGLWDETIVRFENGASEMFDSDVDAYKKFGDLFVPQIYTITASGDEYSINSMAEILDPISIQMDARFNLNGEYTIKANEFSGFENIDVLLEDTQEEEIINLTYGSQYSFNSIGKGTEERFILHFVPMTVGNATEPTEELVFATGNTIHVVISDLSEKELTVYDMTGKIVSKAIFTNQLYTHELNVRSGYYVYCVKTQTTTVVDRILIYNE